MIHLNDGATLRHVDVIHIYLTWPQKKTLRGGLLEEDSVLGCQRHWDRTASSQRGSRAPDRQLLGDGYS
jgi:hypothetical protein